MKLFFDTEFTGLHQSTTIISLGIIAENGKRFYAEFTDFDTSQINEWLQKNVVDKLHLKECKLFRHLDLIEVKGSKDEIKKHLLEWLSQFNNIEFWSDCLAYDWVLLIDLIADYSKGYPEIPKNVYYIPFDICPLFFLKGIDPDISREKFAYREVYSEMLEKKHTALFDAEVIKACFEELNRLV